MIGYTVGINKIVVYAFLAISFAGSVVGCSAKDGQNQPRTQIKTDAQKNVTTETGTITDAPKNVTVESRTITNAKKDLATAPAEEDLNQSWSGNITNAAKKVVPETIVISGPPKTKKLDYTKRGCFVNEAEQSDGNKYSIRKVDSWKPCTNFENGTLTLKIGNDNKLIYRLDYGDGLNFEEGTLSRPSK